MSNDKTPSNTPEQLELPALDDPKAFDVWRTQIMRKPNDEFLETIEALVNTETSLGLLRAATLLTSKDPERSQILVSRALMSNDQTVHLMAKAQLAYLHARKAWSGRT